VIGVQLFSFQFLIFVKRTLMMLPLQDTANNTNKTPVHYRPIFKKL